MALHGLAWLHSLTGRQELFVFLFFSQRNEHLTALLVSAHPGRRWRLMKSLTSGKP